MSEYVTDEAVEKAARALHDQRSMRSRALHELGQPLGDTVYDNERRADARVALEAAVPSIVAQALRDAVDERDRLTAVIERVRELHGGDWVCGNHRHTNPEVGCPDCGVVCESCGDFHPCPTLNIVAEADHE